MSSRRKQVCLLNAPSLPGLSNATSQELVRIEKSLQSIGFFSSGKNTHTSARVVEQMVKHPDGRRVHARAVISGPQELGLPTSADRDKYMAFMKIVLTRRAADGLVANPVRFTGYELLKLLRLSFAGYHYEEMNDWLKRMTATTIMSESIVFLANRKEYVTDLFHVFDQVTLHGQERPDGSRAEEYEVYLSRWQLENINSGFLLQMDLNAYLELRRDIAKALFGHLHVWFYASRGRPIEKRYVQLCQLLHIRAWPHLSKARQILAPSMEELKAIGYISDWDLVKSSVDRDFKLILNVGSRLLGAPALAGLGATGVQPPPALPWVEKLVERGVAEAVARQLSLNIADDQPVDDQIEYIDHLIQSAPIAKVRNPPGFYVALLRDNIGIPLNFPLSRLSAARQDVQATSSQVEAQYDEYRRQSIQQHVEKTYSTADMDKIMAQRMRGVKKAYPHLPVDTQREIAYGLFLREVEQDVSLEPIEVFAKKRRQLRLEIGRSS